MHILSYKPGHDGHVAYLSDGALRFSIEAEKDSWPRYAEIGPSLFLKTAAYLDNVPDVVAVSGWVKGFHSISPPVEAGYWGAGEDAVLTRKSLLFGREVEFFSSSHERSHLLCAYGLSPFPQGQPCYALVWEGNIGAFYRIDEQVKVRKIGNVLADPGNKYAFLYALGDPKFPLQRGHFRFEDAGKLMALVSYGQSGMASAEEREVIDFILRQDSILLQASKIDLAHSPYFNIGVENPAFKTLAKRLSDRIFETFFEFAREHLTEGLPLLISGGCGLNCDWNTAWRECGLFPDVFVPPCTNDSGSAIGTAIDALRHYTGQAKISWSVYAGEDFVDDVTDWSGVEELPFDVEAVARALEKGAVLGWVQGRYEIGPRALGNRSILAAPFTKEMHARLNGIKNREGFRPIAPVCLEEDLGLHFDRHDPSPFMLYFQRVLTDRLQAITHVDGSARVQTVSAESNAELFTLLQAFKQRTGFGVLCNTSLNFNGTGFINRASDLLAYARKAGLDGFVINDRYYRLNTSRTSAEVQIVENA